MITPPITGNYTLVANPTEWRNFANQEIRLNCDPSGGPVNITLCSISALQGYWNVKIYIVDQTGSASINPINIIAAPGDNIDSGASVVVNTNDGSAVIQVADGNSWMALESNPVNPPGTMFINGALDCSLNPNYPAGVKGTGYNVSVAGLIGGPNGRLVAPGDIIFCNTDTVSGDQATVGFRWSLITWPGADQNAVYVAKNGNDSIADGSYRMPFLTIQAAMNYAYTKYVAPVEGQTDPNTYLRPCVLVMPGTYNDGNLLLLPQICIQGFGFNHSRIVGDWSLSLGGEWANYNPPSAFPPNSPPDPTLVDNDMRSSWINVGLFGDINIDFAPVISNEGKLYAIDVRFGGNIVISEKLINPVSNNITFTDCEFTGDVTLNGIPFLFENCVTKGGTFTFNQAIGTGVDNIGSTSGGSYGNIVVNSPNPGAVAPACVLQFNHSAQLGATLTLNGPFSTIKSDISSIPLQSLISLLGGATLNQIERINQSNFSGTTLQRPTQVFVGLQYFDTTIVPNRPIWWNGAAWIDAAGALV